MVRRIAAQDKVQALSALTLHADVSGRDIEDDNHAIVRGKS
jgi:hypothetical protein